MDLDIKELESIINNRDFHKLLGKVETEFLECKKEGYNLENESSKYELAKDVSSFGNVKKGGFILIGIKTKKSKKHFHDEIRSIHPFNQNLYDPRKYKSIIENWIYPKPVNIEIKWHPTKVNPQKGIFIIKIPEQPQTRRPLLIVRTILESGKRSEIVFGYTERKQSENIPKSAIELQQILRDGLYYSDNLDFRLRAIESILQEGVKPPAISKEFSDIDERINETLDAVNLKLERAIILSAYPDSPTNLETLFSSDTDSLKQKLENPPTIRKSGFDLRTLDIARIVKGKFCRVKHVERKAIDLYRDGLLTVAFDGSEDFLCWAAPNEKKGLRINPVVLAESVYVFVLLYDLVIKDMSNEPKKINFRVDFRYLNLNGRMNYLIPFELGSIQQIFGKDKYPSPDENWTKVVEISRNEFSVDNNAFDVLKEIYLYFGIEPERIPYTKKLETKRLIDIEKIKSI